MNSLKAFIVGICIRGVCGEICAQENTLSYPMPDGSGTLRIGIVENNSSKWISGKEKNLHIQWQPLSNTKGFILEIESKKENMTLGWAFGGCDAPKPEAVIHPENCKDNVFNIEGTQITVYHGKVMQLKVTHLIVPANSDIRLSDGHQQTTPLTLFKSGKKTDAPVLSATCLLQKGEKVYFCAYKANQKADYADYMLPALFHKEKQQP